MLNRQGAARQTLRQLLRGFCQAALAVQLALAPASLLAAEPGRPAEAEFEFNSAFLREGSQIDTARFSRNNEVLAGEYLIDLQFNANWIGRASVRFVSQPGSDSALPCIDRAMIERFGLDYEKLSPAARTSLQESASGSCLDLRAMIPDATVSFDLSQLRLEVTVPQSMLSRKPRGYVGVEFWDNGVPSATLGYSLNVYRSATSGVDSTRGHMDLATGINLGSWHLRQRSSIDLASGGNSAFQSIATYLQHDIPAIRSDLTVGDSFTDGAVFDSFGFRGVSLASADQMLPDSQLEYAPVVRGIAQTNARVVITQNGITILETTVSPGAFEIDDLYATGYGGDLNVAIHEADGREENFTVPYASQMKLLRPGLWRYTATAGEVQQPASSGSERFAQATLQHGFNNFVTGFAGMVGAEHYRAAQLGVALNTPVGAVSTEVTQARAGIAGALWSSGTSLQLGFSKLVSATRTNISLAGYRFTSSGFYSFSETQAARQSAPVGAVPVAVGHARSQWQVSINQTLPAQWGSFYLTASLRDYWHAPGTTTQLQGGYTNRFVLGGAKLSYSIAVARVNNALTGKPDNRAQASFSLPLGHVAHSPTLSTSLQQSSSGGDHTHVEQVVVSGAAGKNSQLSYSVTGSQAAGDSAYTASGQFRGAYASMSASLSHGSGYAQQSLGATGGMVLHPGGVTLANQMTDTIGIVKATGAEGARVTNSIGTVINRSGYAVLPYLLPYRLNSISIDPDTAVSPDLEFKSTTELIAPRLNSVVMIQFETVGGRAILVTARQENGEGVPFGANVKDTAGREVGLAGQDGRIYLRGVAESGTLTALWGDAPDQQCSFSYKLPAKQEDTGPFVRIDATCRAGAAASGANGGATPR